jgi:hypothetical protein
LLLLARLVLAERLMVAARGILFHRRPVLRLALVAGRGRRRVGAARRLRTRGTILMMGMRHDNLLSVGGLRFT